MKYAWFKLLLLVVSCQFGYAQDYHFSQFDANPFFINPALTGERLTDYKGIQFNANYRDQMAEFSTGPASFRSIALGADECITSRFAAGQYLYNDVSPDGAFKTVGVLLSGGYNLISSDVETNGNQFLSVGLQLGAYNRSIHPENFTYASQYAPNSADGFDRALPTGENYASQSDFNFNMNFGIYYRASTKSKKLSVFSGLAIYNISKANESYLGLYSPAAIRFNLHGGAYYKASKQLSIAPQFLYMNQAKANEFNLNVLFYSLIEGTNYEPLFGLGLRNKDAVLLQLGLRYKSLTFRMSYDALTNYTRIYKNRGMEFSLLYTLAKKSKGVHVSETDDPKQGATNP